MLFRSRVAGQYAERPGNYLCFFSSHDYLQLAADAFAARHPQIDVWLQSRSMDEAQQQAFVARFVEGGRGIGFAVLGGSFGEGVDLPGARLIGAFVATLGLPQINPVNEQIRQRMDTIFGGVLLIALMGYLLENVVMGRIEAVTIRRWGVQTER